MKHILILTVLLVMSVSSFSQEEKKQMASEITTYYFIRHAEKDRSDPKEKNPNLNIEGLKRADNWSKILGNIKFDAVYSTDYLRTKETAQPTADRNNINITLYEPQNIQVIKQFIMDTKGKTVLIVGHSNTIPSFVNTVIDHNNYDDIDDDNNGNLYIVTIIDGQIIHQLLTIN